LVFVIVANALAAPEKQAGSDGERKVNAMQTEELVRRIRKKDWNLLEPPIGVPTNAVAAVTPLIIDQDQGVRELAVAVVDKMADPEAKQALFKALADRNEIVRGSAARFLEHHCTAKDVDVLVAHLRSHSDEYVREQLALLLGKLGERSAMRPLQERFALEQWPHAKHAMSLALTRLGDPDHRKAYVLRLNQPDPKGRVAALEDLLYIQDKTLAKEVKPLLDDERDGKNVGPSHGAYWIRVCDVAVNVLDSLLEHPFKFEVSRIKRYSGQEIAQAKQLIQ